MAYTKEEAVRLVLEAGQRLVQAGLVARTWGNVSARISDTEFIVTPSGVAYDRLTPALLVTVRISDCSYEGSVKPSSERGIHADAYRLRPDVNFVIHTHQRFATACGVLGKPLRLRDALLGEVVPNAAYAISSTKQLRKNAAREIAAFPEANAFFLRSHGALLLGESSERCFDAAERLEALCRARVEPVLPLPEPGTPPELSAALPAHRKDDALLFTGAPAVRAASRSRALHRPVIDDLAQIAGTDYAVVTVRPGWEKLAAIALSKRNIVFLRDCGAICAAKTPDEAEAVAAVLEKDCLAELYAAAYGARCPLSFADALLQRTVYTAKYSKLKDRS